MRVRWRRDRMMYATTTAARMADATAMVPAAGEMTAHIAAAMSATAATTATQVTTTGKGRRRHGKANQRRRGEQHASATSHGRNGFAESAHLTFSSTDVAGRKSICW